jgi:hypothetical protein
MLRYAIALFGGLLAAACASTQEFSPEAAARIQTIAVAPIDEPEYHVIGNSIPASSADGNVFGYRIDRTRFAAAMMSQNLRVGVALRDALVNALQQRGYTVRVADIARQRPGYPLSNEQLSTIDADAVLDIYGVIAGYTDDAPPIRLAATPQWVPHVGSPRIRLLDPKTGAVLFNSGYFYGPPPTIGEANPELLADPRHIFASYDALIANPTVAAEGIRAGIPKIAAEVGRALAK